ncbi:MAG TPA: RNase adapter RapZ [Candidatus Dormibacteraeota bacterium]|nr:RNase adapter RapZ [Candidatus Dormibacteraeota bacterium]
MALVVVGGASAEVAEAALRAFETAGFTRTEAFADREPNRVLGLPGGGAEALLAADAHDVKYLLVHVGAADGEPGGTYERAHHRVSLDQLPELAERVRTRERPLVTCLAFGFKHGIPDRSAWVVDARFLDNPYWVPELKPLTGFDAPVRDYVLRQPPARALLDGLEATLTPLLAEYARQGRMELTVAFGCTGGRHRSVVLACELAGRLRAVPDIDVAFAARELQTPSPRDDTPSPSEGEGCGGGDPS